MILRPLFRIVQNYSGLRFLKKVYRAKAQRKSRKEELRCLFATSCAFARETCLRTNRRGALLWLVDARVVRMKIDQSPADDRRYCRTMHRAPVKWCVPALRLRTFHVENPFEVWIQKRHVRVCLLFQ